MQEIVDPSKAGLKEYNPSNISADFLAKFMSQRKHLETTIQNLAFIPRYYAEHVSYLKLKSGDRPINRFIIPMTCFCDIKLHQIAFHAEGNDKYNGYGKFAIIMKKEWGVRQGVQPVQYVTSGSLLQKQFTKSFNLYLEAIDNDTTNQLLDDIADILLEQIRFMKPLFGEMPKGDELISSKNFTDEKEWRFVPDIPDKVARIFYIDPLDGIETSRKAIETANDAIALVKPARLPFQVSDVKYIFVDSEDDAVALTKFIMKLKCNKISRINKLALVQKILIYDEMRGDF